MNKDDRERIIAPEHTLRADKYPLEDIRAIGRRGCGARTATRRQRLRHLYLGCADPRACSCSESSPAPIPMPASESMDTRKAEALPGCPGHPQVRRSGASREGGHERPLRRRPGTRAGAQQSAATGRACPWALPLPPIRKTSRTRR